MADFVDAYLRQRKFALEHYGDSGARARDGMVLPKTLYSYALDLRAWWQREIGGELTEARTWELPHDEGKRYRDAIARWARVADEVLPLTAYVKAGAGQQLQGADLEAWWYETARLAATINSLGSAETTGEIWDEWIDGLPRDLGDTIGGGLAAVGEGVGKVAGAFGAGLLSGLGPWVLVGIVAWSLTRKKGR